MLEQYSKKFSDIPNELQLAVKESLLKEDQLKTYLRMQTKWDKRNKLMGLAFKNSKLWRKFVDNPKFLMDYASNISSGAVTTIICHVPIMKLNPAMDTPLLTVDILSGFITDSQLSFAAAGNPGYLKELKARGLIAPGKIEQATTKMNAIIEKVKEVSFRRYLRKRKKIELESDEITEEIVKKSKIPSKYIGEVKKHVKGILQLSYYSSLAGALNAVAYKGLQSAMGKIGYNLLDPYLGFSMWSEASYFAQFAVHAYTRIVLTDKLVGATQSMIDDYFEGLKISYRQNPGSGMIDPMRIELYNTLKYFFIGSASVGIYFASNLWATDVFIRWREGKYDNSLLIFPYQNEFKDYMEHNEESLKTTEAEQDSIQKEVHVEISNMEEFQWLQAQPRMSDYK